MPCCTNLRARAFDTHARSSVRQVPRTALDAFYISRRSPELYRYAYWLCRDRFQAEDLVQETFARAWKARDDLRDETAARSWLYTILRNERARLFERKRFDYDENQDLDEIPDPAADIARDCEVRDAVRALWRGDGVKSSSD